MAVLNRLLRSLTLSLTLRRSLSSSSLNSGIGLGGAPPPPPPPSSLNLSLGGGGGGGDTTNTKNRNVQWVFLGCPGVGKGTYAGRLSHLLRVPHISTGDLVREELSSLGPHSSQLAEIVNQGKLVSDEIIINLLSKRLEAEEAKGQSGFILDGFPRTIRQAEILEGVMDIDLVVNLKLREEALLAKCLGRRICSECGGNYNVACIDIKGGDGSPELYMAPLLPPPHCASKLITRSDDTEEVVKERLRVYNEMVILHLLSAVLPPHKSLITVNSHPIKLESLPSPSITISSDKYPNNLKPCTTITGTTITTITMANSSHHLDHPFRQASRPVEEFYRSRGKLLEFDLPGGIPESWPKLLRALNLDNHEYTTSAAA
ncbi:hypothetical protein TEA_001693 [Camellia sinensis var. sinensis]|uniref:adenylate kinase n=1 Tax=Camellia sinensis var. sinensis TaxID=542762 RepID=A0A4S4DB61_CAMSN|nr:hypothetical protein TEA_001693 [Camellia sinensis var. sinensis]